MEFKQRIRKLRGELSQAEFAQKIGINPNTLRNYEQGQSLPNIAKAAEISKILAVSIEWLVSGHGSMKGDAFGDSGSGPTEELRQTTNSSCANCMALQDELREERRVNRDLVTENRQLWKDNGDLRVEVAEARARAAPATQPDTQPDNQATRKAG